MTALCDSCSPSKQCTADKNRTECKYFQPMTEQEWLQTATTEQLAEFVVKAMILYDNSTMTVLEAIKNAMKNDVKLSNYFMESLLEWLKQPHHKKEQEMKLCWFCPKCKCKKCIFHSIDDNGEESCYWGYIEEVREWLKQPHTIEVGK